MSLETDKYNFKQISADRNFSLKDKIELSIKASNHLDNLHKENVFYKNLTSESFLYDWTNDIIILKEFNDKTNTANSLLYISPEQTGRVNRITDYRTDIYSFGVVLFKLFTKKYPFDYDDPIQIIHAHIAKIPQNISTINSLIPISLSKIVEKLLKKDPEDRYQSINGISYDLKKVLIQLEDGLDLEFVLATNDFSHRPNVPQILYGRQKEISQLKNIFHRLIEDNSKELVVVKGYSGIGKSSLIQTVQKLAIDEKKYFLNAKFEQFNQNIPYHGLIIIFQEYIDNLLLSSEDKLNQFKNILLKTLGENTKLICELIPKLELIVGKQISPEKLNPNETQNRFNLTFLNFIKMVCDFEDSLIIALDDVQWIDNGTLFMLTTVLEEEKINNLMVIVSYRDNEVNNKHKVQIMLNSLKHENLNYSKISLESLKNKYIGQIVSDTLLVSKTQSEQLVSLLEEKTSGNPFFIKEFLYNLYDEGLLIYERSDNCWTWNIENIKSQNITNNVVDLMIKKIDQLSVESKEIFPYLSCLINLNYINFSKVLAVKKDLINKVFSESLELGLLIPLRNEKNSIISYKFSHDKVQEAAYSLLDQNSRKDIHLKIGEYILHNTPKHNLDRYIFDIVEHLNLSYELIENKNEKFDLALFNFMASKKAKKSNSYDNSISFLKKSLQILGDNAWNEHYHLSVEIYSELCESSYLSLKFDDAYKYFTIVLNKSTSLNDKIKITQIQIFSLIAQNKMTEALDLGLNIIKEFGIHLPKEDDINLYYPKLFELYENRDISSLIELPELKDHDKIDILDILNSIMAPAYLSAPHIYPKICFEAVKLSILNGNCKSTANVYAVHSLLLCGFFSDYNNGEKFANLALDVVSKYNANLYSSKVQMISNACVFHWNNHISFSLENLKTAVLNGIDSGDFEYACYSSMYYSLYSILSAKDIEKTITQTNQYLVLMKDLKQEYQLHYTSIWQQYLINLNSASTNFTKLESDVFSESKSLDILEKNNNISTLYCYHLSKAMLGLQFNEISLAKNSINEAKKYLMGVISLFHFNEFYIYESIIYYKSFNEKSDVKKKELLKLLKNNLEYYKKQKKSSAQNNSHKIYAIKAMINDISNKFDKSWINFERAIASANKNGFLQFNAIYNELVALVLSENKKYEFANICFFRAYESYKNWKAFSLANHFFKRYEKNITRHISPTTLNQIEDFNFDKFDLESVTQASLAISEEITLEDLLEKIMTIIIENSGSQIGALILNNNGNLEVEASYGLMTKKGDNRSLDLLPEGLINYVKRSKEQLLYNSKDNVNHFENVSYIKEFKPKSIFCMPIIYKKSFLGILYLENREINNLYSHDKIALLKVLSSQAVISIEHAKLFKQTLTNSELLEKKVKEKTKELQEAVEQLKVFATIDSMTGLNNRRYFFELGTKMFNKAKKENTLLCSLLLDIDNFKHINDTYGHSVGDSAIKFFAKKIEKYNSDFCIVGRLGGDEFVFLIYGKDENYIKTIIKKIHSDISIFDIKEENGGLNMSTSIGYTFLNDNIDSLDELILHADCNMYENKSIAKNIKIRRR